MLEKRNKDACLTYANIHNLSQESASIPSEIEKVFSTDNISNIDVKQLANQENLLEHFSCIDCRQGNCDNHTINIVWWWVWAAMIGYQSLMRTKWRDTSNIRGSYRKLSEYDMKSFDIAINKYYINYYNNAPGSWHSHDVWLLLDRKNLETTDALKEQVSCGAIQRMIHDALFVPKYNLKVDPANIEAFLTIYNLSVRADKIQFVNNDLPHDANYSVIIDGGMDRDEVKGVKNQNDIKSHLPDNYFTTINTKVDDQSAYIQDHDVSHALLKVYLCDFIDYLQQQNNTALSLLLKKICIGHWYMKQWKRSEQEVYACYKSILLNKLAKQLKRTKHNVAVTIERSSELLRLNRLIRVSQEQLATLFGEKLSM